jgi:hypothetical protein
MVSGKGFSQDKTFANGNCYARVTFIRLLGDATALHAQSSQRIRHQRVKPAQLTADIARRPECRLSAIR